MTPEPSQPLQAMPGPWWMLLAVAACLPVCIAVFWRIGRWWITDRPVPLPEDRAWPAVRWPGVFGLGLFVAMQVLMLLVVQAAQEGWLPGAAGHLTVFSPYLAAAQVGPPLLGLAALRLYGRGAAAAAGVRLGRAGRGALLGAVAFMAILPVCLAALTASLVVMGLLKAPVQTHPVLEQVMADRDTWPVAAALVQAGLLAPLAEEFMFRGVLLVTLLKDLGVVAALVISSAIFGLVHLSAEPQAVLPLALLGMALGYVAYHTRSLVAPIVGHALFNILNVVGTAVWGG